MSSYKVQVYATSLIELPWVLKELDKRYGTLGIEEIKKKNGQYAIRYILKYLSYNKDSTCEEIAKDEYDKNLPSQRKLKSITDDVRKFVKNNLIRSLLVYEGKPRQVNNHQIKTYSLSPMGILYAIHLLGNVRETDENVMSGFELHNIDYKFIRTLGKEYADTLPKIFGRFKLFEKIFGKDFESVMIYPLIQIYSEERMGIMNPRFMLPDYVLTGFYFSNSTKIKSIHGMIAEQISLIFYIHLKEGIENDLQDKENFEELIKMSREQPDEYNKRQTKKYLENLKKAKQKWMELMNEDKELKKWYNNFLEEAVKSKKGEYEVIAQYHKEGLSKKYPF